MAQKAEVKYDPLKIMPNQIASKISSLGFEATVLETECLANGVVELKVCLNHILGREVKYQKQPTLIIYIFLQSMFLTCCRFQQFPPHHVYNSLSPQLRISPVSSQLQWTETHAKENLPLTLILQVQGQSLKI